MLPYLVLCFYCTLSSHLDTISLSSFECRNPAKTLRGRSFGPFDAGCFWEIIKYTFEYFLFVGWLTAATAMSNPFRCWSDEIDWVDRVKRSRERSQYIYNWFRSSWLVKIYSIMGQSYIRCRWTHLLPFSCNTYIFHLLIVDKLP